ncbi:MAG: hypothetical protein IJJ33_16500, partial [Victivallales bacterium]|nr:hypothetical protein [Victivallales bacterium]
MKRLLILTLLVLVGVAQADFVAIPPGWLLTLTDGAQGTALPDGSGIRLTKATEDDALLYHGDVPGVPVTPGKTYRAALRYHGQDGSIMVRVDGAGRTPYPSAKGAQGEAELVFTAKPGENAAHFHFVLNQPGETTLTGVLLEECVQPDNLLTHRDRRWRLAFANDGQGTLQSGKDGVQTVTKTSGTGNVVFVGSPDLPIEPGHHYLVTATAKRDTDALSFALMVQMPGGKRTPFPTVSAKQPAGQNETIEYLFTAKEDEKLVRPHLLLGGQGTLAISSITVKELTVA